MLVACPNANGYMVVQLYRDGVGRTTTVHKLVAAAFLGPRPDGRDINHVDGDRTNNAAPNLEYATRRENMEHAARMGLIGNLKLSPADVIAIRASIDEAVKVVAERYGVTDRAIRDIWAGRRWAHVAAG